MDKFIIFRFNEPLRTATRLSKEQSIHHDMKLFSIILKNWLFFLFSFCRDPHSSGSCGLHFQTTANIIENITGRWMMMPYYMKSVDTFNWPLLKNALPYLDFFWHCEHGPYCATVNSLSICATLHYAISGEIAPIRRHLKCVFLSRSMPIKFVKPIHSAQHSPMKLIISKNE